jgi:hypothetical protein
MTSGFTTDKRIDAAKSEGIVGFINKPFTLYGLTKKTFDVLNQD